MKKKSILWSGLLAGLVYCGAVVLGGAIRPGYSHISQFVSELIAAGAPNKSLLDPLFAAYNLLTAGFAWSLLASIRSRVANTRRSAGVAGAMILFAEGIFGLATLFFPQDPVGSPATLTGTLHIILAGLSSLTTMAAMLLVGIWFRADPPLKSLGLYSFASVALVFIFGGLAAALAANQSPISGLMERLTIGGFLQWMAGISLTLSLGARDNARELEQEPRL